MKQTMKQAGIKSSKSLTPDSMYIYKGLNVFIYIH